MIGYHGSPERIDRIHGGTGAGIYLATDRADAETYALCNRDRGYVHTIALADAEIADADDLRETIDTVHEDAGFDPADYSTWAIVEMNEVRDHLASRGFDGVEVVDQSLDGYEHDAVLVWHTDLLTITDINEVTA